MIENESRIYTAVFHPLPAHILLLEEILYTNLRVTDEAYRSIPVYINYD